VSEEFYISLIGEIFDGYSEFDFSGRSLYLKHLCVKDQRYLNLYYEKYKKSALKRGIESQEDVLKRLKDDELWFDEDDIKIETLRVEIENLKKTQKSLFLASQKESIQKQINEKNNDLNSLLVKRKEVVGKTAEDYASNMAAVEIIRYFVFDSPDLNQHAFSEKDFDDLDDLSLISLQKKQTEITDRFNELDIQKSVLRPFFSMYLSFCENARDFFGKPLVDLSVFQMKLVLYGKIFNSIFQYTENIPDGIRDDPEKLVAFSESKNNAGKNKSFIKEDAAASTIFGGTSDDVKALAGDSKDAVNLSDEIKKAGGKLNMEQMMKLAGK
jgi:hypothetical protein